MTPERWVQVERLFHAALECPPVARAAFLDDSFQGDELLAEPSPRAVQQNGDEAL